VLVGIEGSHFCGRWCGASWVSWSETGRGTLDPAAATFLRESSDAPAKLTAPPSGLFLDRVCYAGDSRAWIRPSPLRVG
jgi:hypothetical protein